MDDIIQLASRMDDDYNFHLNRMDELGGSSDLMTAALVRLSDVRCCDGRRPKYPLAFKTHN